MTILNKEKILELARAFIDEGKFDKAIREYEKILLADPTDLRVKLRIAELYTKRKEIQNAIRIYREVADAYTGEGFFLKAVTVFKNILRLNPSLIEVNEELANLYERMGLMADAIRQLDILASALDLRGMHDRVVEIRRKIVKLNPKDGASRIRLAELLQREGKNEEAIDQYEEFARQLEESGADRAKLADLYEKILAHRPQNTEMTRKLIGIYGSVGDLKKALKWLEQARELVEHDAELLAMLAAIYTSQNQHESARSKYMLLADLQLQQGNAEAALDTYFQILVMLPDEEERLSEKVEAIQPGAMAAIVERATARRLELEAEERQRQEAEERGEVVSEEPTWPPLGSKPAAVPGAEEATPAQVISAAELEPEAEAPAAARPQPKPVDVAVTRKRGDGAFDLGNAYRRMGLLDEARGEFTKAFEAYSACFEAGAADPLLRERFSLVEAALKGEASAAVPASTAAQAPAPRPAAPQAAPKEKRPRPAEEPKKEGEGSKKKRISFV